MQIAGLIYRFPRELKWLVGSFIVLLSIGFFSGLMFVGQSTGTEPEGIEQQYLGNESDESAKIMKFRKSEREMLTIIHTHTLSMSFIFFLLGIILVTTKIHPGLKIFLLIEPFVSVILTFGGLYLLWSGISWMSYLVMFSGILMTVTFSVSSTIILIQLIRGDSGMNRAIKSS